MSKPKHDTQVRGDTLTSMLPLPRGLEAETFELGDLSLVIFEYPVGLDELPEQLTKAEAHVVELLALGGTTESIAKKRSASVRTVSNQLASIYRKLGVNTREELLAELLQRAAPEPRRAPTELK